MMAAAMVGEDVGDAMCMARRRLEETAYAFWFLECRKKRSYNELASVMEAGLEGKFPKSGMGELGGGMTKVRAQIQAE